MTDSGVYTCAVDINYDCRLQAEPVNLTVLPAQLDNGGLLVYIISTFIYIMFDQSYGIHYSLIIHLLIQFNCMYFSIDLTCRWWEFDQS